LSKYNTATVFGARSSGETAATVSRARQQSIDTRRTWDVLRQGDDAGLANDGGVLHDTSAWTDCRDAASSRRVLRKGCDPFV